MAFICMLCCSLLLFIPAFDNTHHRFQRGSDFRRNRIKVEYGDLCDSST